MQIIPAIDIKNGKCVRLTQGNFDREKIYSDDPTSIAQLWQAQGATMLHLIDLDGAKTGQPANLETIQNVIRSVTIPIQVGGGIRNNATVKSLLSIGAARIVLGTTALDNQTELKMILRDFSSQIAVALDTKNGKLTGQGWLKDSNKSYCQTARQLEDLGVQRFIYTDVTRDGTLTEPNYQELVNLAQNLTVPIIASGGISTLNHLKQLKSMGVEGAIIGKALYEKKFTLKEAFTC